MGKDSLRVYKANNVFEEAKQRIRWLFSEFDRVWVWHSGGKDSTVVFNLTLEVARELDRLPLPVAWIDQEAEWQCTADHVRSIMYRQDVDPVWLQVPFILSNASSYDQTWLHCWDPEKRGQWIREKDPIAVHNNIYKTDRFYPLFNNLASTHFWPSGCGISGMRAEENLARSSGLTGRISYKDITWGKGLGRDFYTFYPIYDWSYSDVWKAIHSNQWPYNELYDIQYRIGIKTKDMRCSALIHETAIWNMFYMQEFEPDTYDRFLERVQGLDSLTKFGRADFFPSELPDMFPDWREYRDFLLEKLIQDQGLKEKFKKKFDRDDRLYGELDQQYNTHTLENQAWKVHAYSIAANDREMVKIDNMRVALDNYFWKLGADR